MVTRRAIEEINGVRSRAGQEDYGDPETNTGGSVAATVDLPEARVNPVPSGLDETFTEPSDALDDSDDEDLMEQALQVRGGYEAQPVMPVPVPIVSSDHPPSAGGDSDSSDEIRSARADIEQTRAELSSTIDEIKERLSPSHLMEEAKEATLGRVEEAVSHAVDSVKETTGTVYEAVKDKASDAMDAAKEAVHAVSDKVSEKIAGFKAAHHAEPSMPSESRDYDTPQPIPAETSQFSAGMQATGRNLQIIGETLVETIKVNPIPAAMVGFGLGWLILSMQRQQREMPSNGTTYAPADYYRDLDLSDGDDVEGSSIPGLRDRATQFVQNVGSTTSEFAHSASDKASSIAHSAGDKASTFAHSVSDKASDLTHRIGDTAAGIKQNVSDKASDLKDRASQMTTGMRDKASDLASGVKDKAGDIAEATRGQYRAASDGVERFVDEQPLAAGAIALLAGAVIGYLIPSTSVENRYAGPYRDRVVDQASDAFQDVSGKVQNVAQIALGQAKESLSHTVDQAKSQLQQTVEQTKDTVRSEAQNQGLTVPALTGAAA